MMKSNLAVVGAVFFRWQADQFEIALFQRKVGDTGAGLWEFPGGKIELGESPTQALVREVDEELGLKVRVLESLGRAQHEYPSRVIDLEAFWVQGSSFDWVLNDHDAAVWVNEQTWRNYPIAHVDIPLLEKAFKEKRPKS